MDDDDEVFDEESQDEEQVSDEGEDLDEEEQEEQAEQEEQEQQEQAQKESIEKQLQDLEKKVRLRFFPFLTPNEQKLIRQGKKVSPVLATRIDAFVKANKAKTAGKALFAGGGTALHLLPIILVVLIVIIIGATMASMFKTRYNKDGTPAPADYALSGKQIYAARVFYTDDQKASYQILADYTNSIIAAIEGYNNTSSEFTIDVSVPKDALDYNEFLSKYTDTQYGYYRLGQLSYIFTNYAAFDYGFNKTETDFASILADIQYFGLEQSVFENAMLELANEIIKNKWYQAKEENTQPNISTVLLTQDLVRASDFVESKLTAKVFVKDSELGDNEKLPWLNAGATEDEQTKKYLAIMYFPRANFNLKSLAYSVVKTGEGEIKVHYGEKSYDLQAMFVEENNYNYEYSNANLQVAASEKPVVLIKNDASLSELCSIIQAQDEQNLSNYFDAQQVDGKNMYTYKLFNLYAEFNFDDYFSFADQNNSY